jgi:beta-mannosidase
LIDFTGKELWSFSKKVTALGNSSELVHEQNLEGIEKKNAVLVSSLNHTTSTHYLAKPKDLKLQQAEINQEITKTSSGFKIKLSSSTLQKDVFLFTKEKGHFSDNFFDLLPNETVEIEFNTEAATLNDLKIKTLNQFIN